MDITHLKLPPNCIGKKLLLVDVAPSYKYVDGHRTDDIKAYRYTVASPELGFDKLSVVIEGEQLIEKPDSYVEVVFEGLNVFIYWRAGNYDVGATATGIKVK